MCDATQNTTDENAEPQVDCDNCMDTVNECDSREIDGQTVCEGCVEACDCCRCDCVSGDMISTEDDCRTCADCNFECAYCGDTYSDDELNSAESGWRAGHSACNRCYENSMIRCDTCGDECGNSTPEGDWPETAFCTENGEVMCESCYCEHERKQACPDRVRAYRTTTKARKSVYDGTTGRKTGIEIEFQGPSGAKANDYDTGKTCLKTGYDMGSYYEVRTTNPATLERDQLNQFGEFCQQWRDNGATVDSRCGLHVHVDVSDLDNVQVAELNNLVSRIEDDWLEHMPDSRTHNSYCHAESLREIHASRYGVGDEELAEHVSGGNASDLNERYPDARYRTLNLCAAYVHGSAEFRLHGGTLNIDKIRHHVAFCHMLVELCRMEYPVGDVNTVSGAIVAFYDLTNDEAGCAELSHYMASRKAKFAR